MTVDLELACLTIDEVLSERYEPASPAKCDADLARRRLQDWKNLSADGDEAAFAKRLERQKLSETVILERFAGVHRVEGAAPPEWLEQTDRVVSLLKSEFIEDDATSVAFGPLLAPVIEGAMSCLQAKLPEGVSDMLSRQAWVSMVDHLRRRLSNLSELAFYESLLEWRAERISAALGGDADAQTAIMATDLQPFAAYMRSKGFDRLAQRRPVLFRLLAELSSQWSEAYATFLARLHTDRQALMSLDPDLRSDAIVEMVTWGLSDPHNGGHSVLVVGFSGGRRILYKPKELGTDVFLGKFVSGLADLGYSGQLVVPEAVVRPGYGWTAFVENAPCRSEEEVRCYYRRFGAWLAIFHVLSASDMHMENFIARGADPVPVDFEMLLQGLRHRPKTTDEYSEAEWMASTFLEDSVQSVGMLPAYVQGQDDALISMGALEPSVYPVKVIQWDEINTPRMVLHSQTDFVSISSNLPVLCDEPVGIAAYKKGFVDGFRETLAFLAAHSADILALAESAGLGAQVIRRVVRPTRYYYMLLKRLYDHRKMDDGLHWSMEADFTARLFDWDEKAEQPWKLLASERRQLLALGIPHFTMTGRSNVISDQFGPVTRLHIDPGPQLVSARLCSLSNTGPRQVAIVQASLQMPAEDEGGCEKTRGAEADFADGIRDDILSRAFQAEKSTAWLSLNRIDHNVAAQLGVLGYDLYYGSSGIAVFLSALADDHAVHQVRSVIAAAVRQVTSPKIERLVRAIGIGGCVGVGSIVYGLAYVAARLGNEEALLAAQLAARSLTDDMIAGDSRLDVVGGAAGACLSLLALHRRAPADWLIARAVFCGDHLLKCRTGPNALWQSASFDRPLTGVAHGMAGIALAFSRLYRLTGEPRFRAAVQDCIQFENQHFDPLPGNWIDLRPHPADGTLRAPNQWCYGGVGIGLARLAMIDDGAFPPSLLLTDVERAVKAALSASIPKNDSLCCGIGGHIEFLAVAGDRLARRDLSLAANRHVEALYTAWKANGDLRWNAGTKHFNPGLFQGLAGVGFAALRARDPTLPSPLLWE